MSRNYIIFSLLLFSFFSVQALYVKFGIKYNAGKGNFWNFNNNVGIDINVCHGEIPSFKGANTVEAKRNAMLFNGVLSFLEKLFLQWQKQPAYKKREQILEQQAVRDMDEVVQKSAYLDKEYAEVLKKRVVMMKEKIEFDKKNT